MQKDSLDIDHGSLVPEILLKPQRERSPTIFGLQSAILLVGQVPLPPLIRSADACEASLSAWNPWERSESCEYAL